MNFYTYLLYSKQYDCFYIGQTDDLNKRLVYHNNGRVKSTGKYLPWEMVWSMKFETRAQAMSRERKLKNLKSQKRLISFILKNGMLIEDSSPEFLQKIRGSS